MVRPPLSSTRDCECQRTARDSTWASTSRPAETSASWVNPWSDAGHVLLDDRALVEVAGHVVRGRAHQLDPAVERLMVGLGTLEAGQERVVDVDRAAGQRAARVVAQHLHVAGQHHEVDAVLVDESQQLRLGLRLGGRRHRHVVERDVVRAAQGLGVGVVGDDQGHLDLQRSRRGAEQQVVEAVQVARHHDQGAERGRGVPELVVHVELLGHRGEVLPQPVRRGVAGRREVDPHEEPTRVGVAVLLALQDVAAVLHQETRDRVHDPRPVGAREHQDEVARGGRPGDGRRVHVALHETKCAIGNSLCATVAP